MRIVIDYDRGCPFTTGVYLSRAAARLGVEEIAPDAADPATDAWIKVDDSQPWGTDADLRALDFECRAFWAIDTHTAYDRVLNIARHFPRAFAAQRDGVTAFGRDGVTAAWLPCAAEPEDWHADRNVARDIEVAFVGNVWYPARIEVLRLVDAAFDLIHDNSGDPRRIGELYSRARCVINHSVRNDVNMRIFEAASCGAALVTNRIDAQQWGGIDLAFHEYDTPEQAVDAIDGLLAHNNGEETAANALCAREGHTYTHRLKTILEAL